VSDPRQIEEAIHLSPARDDPERYADDDDTALPARVAALEKRCEKIERLLYLLGGEGSNAFLAEMKKTG
jgi:hypothetical protein